MALDYGVNAFHFRIGKGVVGVEVKSAAFLAFKRTVDYQFGDGCDVAQLDQIGGNGEVPVIFFDFFADEFDPVFRPFQPLVGTVNADIVPHEAADLIPVMGNQHQFIGIGGIAGRPVECRFFIGKR